MRGNVLRLARVGAAGTENLSAFGRAGGVVAANHFTWADPVLIDAMAPRPIGWIAKTELYTNALASWFFQNVGCIPVDRRKHGNEAVVRAAIEAVEAGQLVGIFPEGTRSSPGALLPPKTGAVRVALRTGCPLVPVGILSDQFWPKTRKSPDLGARVHIAVGEPIRLGRDAGRADDKETCRKLSADLMERIAALLAEARAARDRGEVWQRP
jgi:1-acyl-sn-glycerol-3-phosphate acyltransferase